MEKNTVANRTDSFAETCSSIISGVISVFLVFAVIAVPLIYDKSYFNILETKYKCFYMSALVMLTVPPEATSSREALYLGSLPSTV